jgi:hypothetical protein
MQQFLKEGKKNSTLNNAKCNISLKKIKGKPNQSLDNVRCNNSLEKARE